MMNKVGVSTRAGGSAAPGCSGMIMKIAEPTTRFNTRAEQEIDLAHIVGGARHRVAHRLQAVEGHAFTQQADVQARGGYHVRRAEPISSALKFRPNCSTDLSTCETAIQTAIPSSEAVSGGFSRMLWNA